MIKLVAVMLLIGVVCAVPNTCSTDYVCTTLYRPICGRLVIAGQKIFKTFGNQCLLSRENCNHPTTPYIKHGVIGKTCEEQKFVSVCSASCILQWKPICGLLEKGGQKIYKTFSNECTFWHRNCVNTVNQYVPQGDEGQSCEDQELTSVCSSACPKIYLPTCGLYQKFGQRIYTTFDNECLLEQYNCRNPELEQVPQKPTGQTCAALGLYNYCSKGCDRSYIPLCAWRNVNGKIEFRTFQNECHLVQENCMFPKYPFRVIGDPGQSCQDQGWIL